MNRREFLLALVTVPLAAKYIPPDPLSMYFSDEILTFRGAKIATSLNWDENRIKFFANYAFRMYVDNPAHCAVITDIAEPDNY